MLNEELISPKSENQLKEICKLKRLINKYKKHDEQRTKYYAEKMQELGELQSLFAELSATNDYFRKCLVYKQQLSVMSKKLYLQKLIELSDENTILIVENNQYKKRFDKLKIQYESLRKANSELVYKLLHQKP